MKNVFDWHKWNAETYEKPEDILRAFDSLNVCGKRIADIRIIGVASHDAHFAARQAQYEAGVPYEVIDSEEFAYSKQTVVPCVIEAIEPIVFTFTDGSTFELQPRYRNSLRMSINQIPQDIVTGTNHVNINVNEIFQNLIGATLRSLTVQIFTKEDIWGEQPIKTTEQSQRYEFLTDFSDNFGISITQRGGAWYSVEVRNQNHYTHEGNEIHKIPLNIFNKALTPTKQILILEGHDYSSYFWINPVKILDVSGEYENDRIEEYTVEEISIEEDDVWRFLYYFLEKHFDSQIQVTGFKENEIRKFEWYLEHNIYTYDSVKKIIAEIRSTANMFRSDFDNPELSEIKERFNLYTFIDEDSIDNVCELSDQQRNEVIRENIGVALDFYERFCRRMELMMEHAPQYNLISFMGP